ncbi:MAG: DUF1566 domain-containing protein [Desulfobulbaceae bacterium]|nr:MAG: DUF1566 domain-containing protein [Desulfobulbaceae bacterium]
MMEQPVQLPQSLYNAPDPQEGASSRIYDLTLLRPPEIVARDGRYVAYANGLICDCYSRLEWMVGPDRDTSWNEAQAWVDGLNCRGKAWGLPTLEQLGGLYRKNIRKHQISPLFGIEPTDVWSCEIKNDESAWAFNFIPGSAFWTYRTMSRRFRGLAVRPKPEYGWQNAS